MKYNTVIALLLASTAMGQTPKVIAPPSSDMQLVMSIGPQDLVSLMVSDCPELTRSFRVSSDGTLALPLIKNRLKAAGLMPVDLEKAIAEELTAQQILVDPIVNAAVMEYRSRPVSIAGAVKHPVTFQAVGDTTLLDAITKAEGLSPEAGPEILVTRKTRNADGTLETAVQKIPVKGLIDNADPLLNIRLEGNEEIRVPDGGKLFVAGNVKKPGAFPLQDDSGMTVLKALALSEGLLPFTSKLAYIYRRDAATGQRLEVAVALDQIIRRKAEDVPILPDDILYIPDNNGRKVTANVLERIANFGASTASGVLIWGAR